MKAENEEKSKALVFFSYSQFLKIIAFDYLGFRASSYDVASKGQRSVRQQHSWPEASGRLQAIRRKC